MPEGGAALRVNAFPNAKSLALWAGQERGIFADHGLAVSLELTQNSHVQRARLAAGDDDIVHSAIDNAAAMILAGQDLAIVMGGDSGMNEFFVQGDVRTFADLRGRWLAVDAPDTAYALLAKKILRQNGLREAVDYTVTPVGNGGLRLKAMLSDPRYGAAILNLPFTITGEAQGLHSLGRAVDLLGPYQAVGAFTSRAFAEKQGALLERYIGAYVSALRWVLTPANGAAAQAMLARHLGLSPSFAEKTYAQLADPSFGFTPDARFDMRGFAAMIALRDEVEGEVDSAPLRDAVDLSFYDRAMRALG